jgi:hypothetical protein
LGQHVDRVYKKKFPVIHGTKHGSIWHDFQFIESPSDDALTVGFLHTTFHRVLSSVI